MSHLPPSVRVRAVSSKDVELDVEDSVVPEPQQISSSEANPIRGGRPGDHLEDTSEVWTPPVSPFVPGAEQASFRSAPPELCEQYSRLSNAAWQRRLLQALVVSRSLHTLRDMKDGSCCIDENSLIPRKKVGSGSFGEVFLCSYASGGKTVNVAMKNINIQMRRDSDIEDFLNECRLLRKLQHSCIVDFIGVTTPHNAGNGRQRISLITEFCNSGSLRSLLDHQLMAHVEAKGRKVLSQKVLELTEYTPTMAVSWLLSMAKALKYLHSASPMIIHRDIKLDNVLIHRTANGKVQAKLADFGLSAVTEIRMRALGRSFSNVVDEDGQRMTARSRSMGGVQLFPGQDDTIVLSGRTGTVLYMAPEVFQGEKYNEKCDIFSFGMAMFELMTGLTMDHRLPAITKQELWAHASRTAQGARFPIPDELPSAVRSLISDCWAQRPEDRPTAREVEQRLQALKPSIGRWERSSRKRKSLLAFVCCSSSPLAAQ